MSSATVPLLEDELSFGEETNPKRLPHPYVTFFHLFFRGASIVVYLLCGLFIDSFITSFVFVVLLLSADFWLVKNISGRLLVGLRWWNYVDDDGVSHWVYESRKNNPNFPNQVNAHEQRVFWLALILCPVLWAIFFIIALFGLKLKWLVLVVIALSLNGANLLGYIKCNFGENKDLGAATTDFVRGQVLRNAFDMMTRPQPTTAKPTNIV